MSDISSNTDVLCPDCGALLRFMAVSPAYFNSKTVWFRLYHCEKCHADWESKSCDKTATGELKRKFWG